MSHDATTLQPANDNYHRALAGDGSDLPSPIRYLPHEQKGIRMQKKRLAKLESRRPDWISPPVNDNQAWPLAQQLRKEGNDVLLRVAERYRAIYDAAQTEVALIGTMPDDLYSLPKDQRVHNREDGSVGYKGTRRVKSAVGRFEGDDGNNKATPITDDVQQEIVASNVVTFPRKPSKPVSRKWNGDRLINEAIDSRGTISHLRWKLGPLVDPFEDAVLHGETLSAIGESRGAGSKTGGAAGRVLVMLGLQVVREALAELDAASAA